MVMPKPGTAEYEIMVNFMRADLESGMGYSKIILAAKKIFEAQGRDFEKEFEDWQKSRKDN